MIKIIYIIFFISCVNATLFSKDESDSTFLIESEVGITLGVPSAINLLYVYHLDDVLLKVSGNYMGDLHGVQFDVGYKLFTIKRTYHALTVAGGFSRYPANNNIFDTTSEPGKFDYFSINYILCSKGYFISLGLSEGKGNINSPRLALQIGYTFQFPN